MRNPIRLVRTALKRHRGKGALVLLLLMLAALAAPRLLPQAHYCEARLQVRLESAIGPDGHASGSQSLSGQAPSERQVESLIADLHNRDVLERVVRKLGAANILGDNAAAPLDACPRPLTKEEQRALQHLERTVRVSASGGNALIVACTAHSPEAARQIVATLVDQLLDVRVPIHRPASGSQSLEEQSRQALAACQHARQRLRAAKDRLGPVTYADRRQELEDQVTEVELQRRTCLAERKTAAAKIESLKRQLESLPQSVVPPPAVAESSPSGSLDQSLASLQATERELAARMQDQHPQLLSVRQQIAKLRTSIREQPAERLTGDDSSGPLRRALEGDLRSEESRADSLRGREQSLAALQEQLRGQLDRLQADALAIDQLEQQVALAEANYRRCTEALEQPTGDRSLAEEATSSLIVVQPVRYAERVIGPPRAQVLAMGLALAAMGSLGTMLLAAWLNPLVARAEDIASLLDLPVIGVLPPQLGGA